MNLNRLLWGVIGRPIFLLIFFCLYLALTLSLLSSSLFFFRPLSLSSSFFSLDSFLSFLSPISLYLIYLLSIYLFIYKPLNYLFTLFLLRNHGIVTLFSTGQSLPGRSGSWTLSPFLGTSLHYYQIQMFFFPGSTRFNRKIFSFVNKRTVMAPGRLKWCVISKRLSDRLR